MMKKCTKVWTLLVLLVLCPLMASGEDSSEEKVAAIQNRIFFRHHELSLSGGYIADDDYFHVFPLAASYTFNYDEQWSIEALRFQYMFTTEKDLKADLLALGVQPSRYPEQRYALHSHLVYKPLYGKAAFLNRSVINNETYFFAGGGITQYEWLKSYGESESETAPSLSLGGGMKFFLNDRFCLNFEIRDLLNFRKDDMENHVSVALGLGFRFNLSARQSQEDPAIEKLRTILEK